MNASPPSPAHAPVREGEHIAFVTGRLAEPSLRRVLESIHEEFGFTYEVHVLGVSVAALLTPTLVARRLHLESPGDRVILPGYCEGDHEETSRRLDCPIELGPRDLRDLPRWFADGGQIRGDVTPPDYGDHRLEILAEINHAPRLGRDELLEQARSYRASGADVIDVGCIPDAPWSEVGEAVRALRDEGFRVAIDSFDAGEVRRAVAAGAELVLSVNGTNVETARDLGCEVVAIPDQPGTLEGLDATLERLAEWNVPRRLDPIIEPLGFGFAASLGRYLEVRERYPDEKMMMGVGNLTELTDCDSAGLNVLLAGFCEECRIESVLTTEVIPWARSSVRELDLARRLMHYAVRHRTLPKHLHPGLIVLRDPRVREHGLEALEELAASLTDPGYRIFAEGGELHLMNRDHHVRGRDAFELFEQIGMDDPSHAFYLGWELAKASIALDLGKDYRQDQALDWGHLSREEVSHVERQRRRATGGEESP